MTEIKVEVKAGRETSLASSGAVIFGIDHTSVSLLGFTVKDVKANMSRREVRSVCCFSVSQVDPEASNKFKKGFSVFARRIFNNDKNHVLLKIFQLSQINANQSNLIQLPQALKYYFYSG